MESLLSRYRNLTVLLVVTVAQLLLIAYQVKTSRDVPLVRVWAVSAVTPLERILEIVRRNTWGFVEDYFVLLHTRENNDRLQKEVGRLKLENQYLQAQLSTADRVQALGLFQAKTPSKTIAARIIGNGTGANSKSVFVDRGSGSGIESGMAVITPDGIIGKVVASYPTASLVLLITDSNFAAGVISRKNQVRGTLRGQGHDGTVLVDYVPNDEPVDVGDWFYTSGDDRIFPKGLPAGKVTSVHNARNLKEISLAPSGFQYGLDEVLIVLEAVHQNIPDTDASSSEVRLAAAPPGSPENPAGQPNGQPPTDADKLKEQYRQVGEAEHHVFGQGGYAPPPDFTKMPGMRESANSASSANPAAAPKPPAESPSAQPAPVKTDTSAAVSGAPASTVPTPARQNRTAVNTQANLEPAPKPKAKPSAPLLITDPTDADPSEPAIPAPTRKSEPPLDEFGQPKQAVKPKPKAANQQQYQ